MLSYKIARKRGLGFEFSLLMIGLMAILLFGSLFGAVTLMRLDREQSEALERAYIESELNAFKAQMISDIQLKRYELLTKAIPHVRAKLNLSMLKLDIPNREIESNSGGRKLESYITGSLPLVVNEAPIGTITYQVGSRLKGYTSKVFLFVVLMFFIFALVVTVFVSQWLESRFFSPVEKLIQMSRQDEAFSQLEKFSPTSYDVDIIRQQFLNLIRDQIEKQKKIAELERKRSSSELASQVAHDIRSPLSALSILLNQLGSLPEETRVLMRSAIVRIQDITNNLLVNFSANHAKSDLVSKMRVQLISANIEMIVSEKRLKYQDSQKVDIVSISGDSIYSIFAVIDSSEFRRVLSNLIDNAIESYPQKQGRVIVKLSSSNDFIQIQVIDSGCGIAPEILRVLGKPGVTSGKENGHGLGVFHAKTVIEQWGGKFEIQSEKGKGTAVQLSLRKESPPSWLLPRLDLHLEKPVVILDDDDAIHHTWDRLLAPYVEKGLKVFHFKEPTQLITWIKLYELRSFTGLFDCELIGCALSGLDLIETYRLERYAALVTSHFENEDVLRRCERKGIKIVPKGLVANLPIHGNFAVGNSEYVLALLN